MNLSANWAKNSHSLSREWKLKNFKQALGLVNAIGAVAEELKHHPDINFGWGYVKLMITTHDAGNSLTDKDFTLAAKIDEIQL